MILRTPYLYFYLVLWSLSCSEPLEQGLDSQQQQVDADHFLVNVQGDTIPTGIPVPLSPHRVDPSTVVQPVYSPLKKKPAVVPAHNNRIPAGKPRIVTVPGRLPAFIPGENGVSLPERVPARGKLVPALHPEPIPAQPPTMKENALHDIRNLDVEQGLKASAIYTILEDSRNNFWFGAMGGGVSRYDGTYFTHFTTQEGLIDDDVTAAEEDQFGNLWFGTFGGGACRYDGQHFVHYSTREGLSGNEVAVIFRDSRDILWFGTEGGLSRFHPASDGQQAYFTNYTVENGLSADEVEAIVEDRNGHLWLGTVGGGLTRLELNNGKERFFHLTTREGLGDDVVVSLAIDEAGALWIGTYTGGAHRYDGEQIWQFTKEQGLGSNEIHEIVSDGIAGVWLGTEGGGAVKYEPDGQWGTFTKLTTREGLSRNIALSLLVDSRGNVWVGTYGAGVNRYQANSFQYLNIEKGLLHNEVRAIMEDTEGAIWIGTWGGGVSRYDGERFMHLTTEEGLCSNYIGGITEDREGKLWFSTNAGVQAFDGSGFLHISEKEGLSANRTLPVFEDQQGRIWISTVFHGMSRYSRGGGSGSEQMETLSIKEGLATNNVWAISGDGQGQVWIGTWGGGLGRITSTDSITYYTSGEGLIDDEIWSLFHDSEGTLWIATNHGLNYVLPADSDLVDQPGSVSRRLAFGEIQALGDKYITGVLEDAEKNLWISTQKDITVLQTDQRDALLQGRSPKLEELFSQGQQDGLKKLRIHANTSNAIVDSRNRIWWGSTNGISLLDLNHFVFPRQPPRTPHLDHLLIEQQYVDFRRLKDSTYRSTWSFGTKLAGVVDSVASFHNYPVDPVLPHRINNLTFNFSTVDWQGPHHLQYSYRLEGLDDHWSPTDKDPRAIYRNLPAGTYTFQVKAIGAAGKWSEVFAYPFTILPPWWQTGWAYLLYALMFLALMTGLYLYQRRRWQLQTQLEVEQEKAHRLQELDHFKSRFYTNITHEFRTPLTVISGMADQIEKNDRIKNLIRRNSERLLQMINQLLDLSKLESKALTLNWVQGDIIPYLEYLTESCHSLADSKHLNLAFFSREDSLIMDFDEARLQQILINILSNAIKFTPEYGSVKVIASRVKVDDKPHLSLQIQDTGQGIPEEELPNIFERFYQVDASTTRVGEGTGIGLALVQELIQLLEGRIEVKSVQNKGTTFEIHLPIHHRSGKLASKDLRNELDNAEPMISPMVNSDMDEHDDLPMVLIIEDNVDVVEYIFSCLGAQYSLQSAGNGKEGLDKALEIVPDVIISDVMMPEMDGFELCRQLRSDRRTSHIPIILLTARATQEDRITGLSQGADAYLTKPFDKRELLIRLEQLAQRNNRLREKLSGPVEPDDPYNALEQQEAEFLREVDRTIDDHLGDESFDTNRLCRAMAMSRAQLYRKLKALTGQSTARYIRRTRLERAKTLLETTDLPVGEISVKVGFKDFSHFSRTFAQEFEQTPSDTRK